MRKKLFLLKLKLAMRIKIENKFKEIILNL